MAKAYAFRSTNRTFKYQLKQKKYYIGQTVHKYYYYSYYH